MGHYIFDWFGNPLFLYIFYIYRHCPHKFHISHSHIDSCTLLDILFSCILVHHPYKYDYFFDHFYTWYQCSHIDHSIVLRHIDSYICNSCKNHCYIFVGDYIHHLCHTLSELQRISFYNKLFHHDNHNPTCKVSF